MTDDELNKLKANLESERKSELEINIAAKGIIRDTAFWEWVYEQGKLPKSYVDLAKFIQNSNRARQITSNLPLKYYPIQLADVRGKVVHSV